MSPFTDEALLELVLAKDVDALEQLYDRYAGKIFTILRRIVKDSIVAEGLVQDTFVQLWEKAHTFNNTGSVGAWLCRIARNKGLDYLRRTHARPRVILQGIDDLKLLEDRTSTTSNVAIYVEHQVRHEHLQSALLQLSPEQEACVRLAFFDGMTHSEIATYTTTPLGTVKTRIRSALVKLASVMRAYGYYSFEHVS